MNPEVDHYIAESDRWPDEMSELRSILLRCGLGEEIKWAKPCYTHDGANIAVMQEMKGFLSLMFFKGALLGDPQRVLEEQGPNTQSARRVRFTSTEDVERLAQPVAALAREAMAVEAAGLEVPPTPELELAVELQDRLDKDPVLAAAFAALTPGRRREYNMHISGARQSKTRETRVDRNVEKILRGKGLRDR